MFGVLLKKFIFILIIIFFNLIIGLRTSIGFFFFFFWFLLSGLFLNIIWIALQYAGAKILLVRKVNSEIEEDNTLEIEAQIENKGTLPIFNLVLKEHLLCATAQEKEKNILIEYLGPGVSLNLKYSCLCSQRGRYLIGPLEVYFFDPCGLFFLKRTHHLYSELYVYPKTCRIKKFPELLKGNLPWFGISTVKASGDEDEFFGVREYKAGDPIRRIHWISTARKNSLIVKQFQNQGFSRVTIMFNLEKEKNFGEGKESVAEYIIRIAASVSKYLIERNISTEIIAHAGEVVHIPSNRGTGHLSDIFKFLAVAQAESKVTLGELFEHFSKYILDNSNLIVIMLDKDWEYLPSMLSLDKRNVFFIPLILISSTFLYSLDKKEIVKDVGIKLSQAFNLNPILFSQGTNLEEKFS